MSTKDNPILAKEYKGVMTKAPKSWWDRQFGIALQKKEGTTVCRICGKLWKKGHNC